MTKLSAALLLLLTLSGCFGPKEEQVKGVFMADCGCSKELLMYLSQGWRVVSSQPASADKDSGTYLLLRK
jgi:hypothetical protein